MLKNKIFSKKWSGHSSPKNDNGTNSCTKLQAFDLYFYISFQNSNPMSQLGELLSESPKSSGKQRFLGLKPISTGCFGVQLFQNYFLWPIFMNFTLWFAS
jgi:hypothetical protein